MPKKNVKIIKNPKYKEDETFISHDQLNSTKKDRRDIEDYGNDFIDEEEDEN